MKKQSYSNVKFVPLSALNQGELKQHMASVHEEIKSFKCEICNYSCFKNIGLKQHMASFHEEIKPIKYEVCNYSCSKKGELKQHVASVHEEMKLFKCEVCDYNCSVKSELGQHIALVHDEKESAKPLRIASLNIRRGLFGKEEILIHTINEHKIDMPSVSERDFDDFDESMQFSIKGF